MLVALLLAVLGSRPPESMTGHAGVQVGDRVYVFGGSATVNIGHLYSESWTIDPVRGTWNELAPMKVARAMAAAANLDGAVYVAGGMLWSGEHLRSVERFDLKSKTWTDVAPMTEARSRFPLVSLKGKLYAVSGMRGANSEGLNTPTVEAYDPKTGVWRRAGTLNHARHGFAAVAWKGRVYVFGGNDAQSERSAERWDPNTGKSEDLPDMTFRRGFHGVVFEGGRLVNFGGRPAGQHPSAYDPVSRKWSDLPCADVEANRFVSAKIGDKVWLVGGESLNDRFPLVRSLVLSEK